jgi:divalent metal cation (Fe/Co/Zn/Cd) transporter
MSGALFLANESKNLLVGESADQKQVEEIRNVIQADPEVSRVGKLLTMQLAPEEVLLLVEIEFADKLSSDGLERATKRIEGSIREKHSSVKRIFLEADSLEKSA